MPSSATPQLALLIAGHRIPMKPFDGTTYRANVTTKLPSFSDKISRGDQKARSTDPVVSHDAAADAEPAMRTKGAQLLAVFRAYGPCTADYALAVLGWRTGHQRVKDLTDKGKLRDTGRTAPTRNGSDARIFEVAP